MQSSDSAFLSAYFEPPRFVVDLDVPARERWKHIIPQYLDQIHEVLEYVTKVRHVVWF